MCENLSYLFIISAFSLLLVVTIVDFLTHTQLFRQLLPWAYGDATSWIHDFPKKSLYTEVPFSKVWLPWWQIKAIGGSCKIMVSSEETTEASSPTCILEHAGHLSIIQQSFTANYSACVTEKTPPEDSKCSGLQTEYGPWNTCLSWFTQPTILI